MTACICGHAARRGETIVAGCELGRLLFNTHPRLACDIPPPFEVSPQNGGECLSAVSYRYKAHALDLLGRLRRLDDLRELGVKFLEISLGVAAGTGHADPTLRLEPREAELGKRRYLRKQRGAFLAANRKSPLSCPR